MTHQSRDSASSGSILLYFVVFLLIVGAISLAYQSMVLTSQTFVLNSKAIAERDALADSAVAVILSECERQGEGYRISKTKAETLKHEIAWDQSAEKGFPGSGRTFGITGIEFKNETKTAVFTIAFSIDGRDFTRELKVPYTD